MDRGSKDLISQEDQKDEQDEMPSHHPAIGRTNRPR